MRNCRAAPFFVLKAVTQLVMKDCGSAPVAEARHADRPDERCEIEHNRPIFAGPKTANEGKGARFVPEIVSIKQVMPTLAPISSGRR
jgi:hypothetical protein